MDVSSLVSPATMSGPPCSPPIKPVILNTGGEVDVLSLAIVPEPTKTKTKSPSAKKESKRKPKSSPSNKPSIRPWTAIDKIDLLNVVTTRGASIKHFEGVLEGRSGLACFIRWKHVILREIRTTLLEEVEVERKARAKAAKAKWTREQTKKKKKDEEEEEVKVECV